MCEGQEEFWGSGPDSTLRGNMLSEVSTLVTDHGSRALKKIF